MLCDFGINIQCGSKAACFVNSIVLGPYSLGPGYRGELGPLQWLHIELDGVSNHQPHDCLLNCLFGRRSKKTSKLRVTGLCAGNSPETGGFPAQMDSNAENVSIWWRHHEWHGCWCPDLHCQFFSSHGITYSLYFTHTGVLFCMI